MGSDKYRWDGDTPDERDSELREGRSSLPREAGASTLDRVRQPPARRFVRRWVWVALAAAAAMAVLVTLLVRRGG